MLAGLFATWTTAGHRQCGGIDTHLVGVFATALALSPECLSVLAQLLPTFGICELLPVFSGVGVWGQCYHLIAASEL